MQLVERMIHDPMRCLGCGKGNTPDNNGEIGPYVDLEQEVGWMDHAYLCIDCASTAGALAGMISEDESKDLRRQIRQKSRDLHDLRTQLDEVKRRLVGTQKKLLKV